MAATIWKGQLTFGLVSMPVKLVRAARAEKVHMHQLQRQTGARVRQVFVAPAPPADPEAAEEAEEVASPTLVREAGPRVEVRGSEKGEAEARPAAERPVSREDLVRGYEYEKGRYVEFQSEELNALAPRNSSEIQIVEFVQFSEVDPVYLENSYYVVADRGGEKPYSLLYAALQKTGLSAIGEFVMHRRDQTLLLRPGRKGLIGHTLFHADEVRQSDEFAADVTAVVGKEMELAVKLVEALQAPWQPEKFQDKYRERLQAAIAEKVAGGSAKAAPAAAAAAPVIDIMAALKESLKHARKPAASEATTKKKRSAAS